MDKKALKELRQIRNVLILLTIKSGATATEVGNITGIGYSNISALVAEHGSGGESKKIQKKKSKAKA